MAVVLAGEFGDEGFDEEAAVADIEENVAGDVGEDGGVGVLDGVVEGGVEGEFVDGEEFFANGEHEGIFGEVKVFEADEGAEVVGAGEAAGGADALLEGGVAGYDVVDELGGDGVDEHGAGHVVAGAVYDFAEVVGG